MGEGNQSEAGVTFQAPCDYLKRTPDSIQGIASVHTVFRAMAYALALPLDREVTHIEGTIMGDSLQVTVTLRPKESQD